MCNMAHALKDTPSVMVGNGILVTACYGEGESAEHVSQWVFGLFTPGFAFLVIFWALLKGGLCSTFV